MRFLLIAQTPSENTKQLARAAYESMCTYAGDEHEVIQKAPTEVIASDLQGCDGLVLGTLENIGALSGLTKDMFDRCYNDWLGRHEGLAVAIYIRAGLDGTATKRTLISYANAQSWRLISPPLLLHGTYETSMCETTSELAGRLSAGVAAGIY
ncbi:MAG: flavodoxin family protein [Candidatus Puniceispirillaceae bacterium]